MQKRLTVSQLNAYIAGVFEDEFVLHDVVVRGEIYELKVMGARTFFTLKEGGSTLYCVTFAHIRAEVGDNADVTGTVTFYAKSGRVSFVAEDVSPVGEGDLLAKLRQLKETLRKEGVFDNRPPLPQVVRKAVVITSEYGAVLHDILSVCRANDPSMDICLCDVRVQGTESAAEIARAINDVNSFCRDADVIVLARGGGSASDLAAYNEECVARAVAQSRLPVISAVGHETDYTLCDLCASARAGTPSIAAAMISAPAAALRERVLGAADALKKGINRLYDGKKHRLMHGAMRVIALCERLLERRSIYVSSLLTRISGAVESKASAAEARLAKDAAALEKLSPLGLLSIGYAKVECNGREVRKVSQLSRGDKVTVYMRDGKFGADVTESEETAYVGEKEDRRS